jgi:molecular chaperone GrpE
MMMKKKVKEQEEFRDETINKPTDNKQHSHNPENNAGNDQESSVSGGTASATAETSNSGSSVSDKFVSDGKLPEEKLAEMQDKYIRLSAEFDNYRKRTLREKMELSKYAAEDILVKLLPIMDDFERALSHMDTATDCVAMKDGIDLIYNKFSEFLRQNGIKEIEAMNIGFDVELHDAIAKIPVQEEEQKGKVVDVVQKGYYIRDKVLRHSKVVVGE